MPGGFTKTNRILIRNYLQALNFNSMTDPLDEQWKPVVGFASYEVSNLGRVRRCLACRGSYVGKLLKLKLGTRRYWLASLYIHPKIHERAVHQLVMHAFVGPQAKGIEVRHLDGSRTNNRLDNLAYGTKADNIADAKRHGTFPLLERRPGAKLTRAKAVEIYTSKESTTTLSERYGVDIGVIRQVKLGLTWRSVTIDLPDPTWDFKPRFAGEQLAILHDRSLTRAEVMALLGISLTQVKYFRKCHPFVKKPFVARFSAAQWSKLCDRSIRAIDAASQVGVSLSYVKSVRRTHGQGPTGDRDSTARERGAKLTRNQAIEIYTSADNALVLAERYSVTPGCIRRIKIGETWRSATVSLPEPIRSERRKLTDVELGIVRDRSLTREHIMTQLNLTLHQVEYWRGLDPIPQPAFRDRFSDEQWCIACDTTITITSAAKQLGVSTSYIKTIRRKAMHRQSVPEDRNATAQERGAKLTQQQAIEIYISADDALVLAERYDVTPSHIRRIKIGETWRSATVSLPKSPWAGTRKLTDAELSVVRDRALTREHIMTKLNLTLNQVEYYRELDPAPRPAFRERFSDDQWRIACDSTISVNEAARQLGVSNSYIKTTRAKQLKVRGT
jgi:hypothetical protein